MVEVEIEANVGQKYIKKKHVVYSNEEAPKSKKVDEKTNDNGRNGLSKERSEGR